MPKRYFTKQIFADDPKVALEMDVGIGWLPLTPEKIQKMFDQARTIATRFKKDATFTLWKENDDGTIEEIPEPNKRFNS